MGWPRTGQRRSAFPYKELSNSFVLYYHSIHMRATRAQYTVVLRSFVLYLTFVLISRPKNHTVCPSSLNPPLYFTFYFYFFLSTTVGTIDRVTSFKLGYLTFILTPHFLGPPTLTMSSKKLLPGSISLNSLKEQDFLLVSYSTITQQS